jgi:phosphoglycolate phosphatase-like HAD superfamily hydrolase
MVIFWDFDGVIKDSVQAKSDAFRELFFAFGVDVVKRIIDHHEANSGMSRFEKIPIYLVWSGCELTPELYEKYLILFSKMVESKVVESNWVPGVLELIKNRTNEQFSFLISATPQDELEKIINTIELTEFFHKIVGAPNNKSDAIKDILEDFGLKPNEAILIGDSLTDYQAAFENNISFVLRKTPLNIGLQKQLDCIMIKNFLGKSWDSFKQKI